MARHLRSVDLPPGCILITRDGTPKYVRPQAAGRHRREFLPRLGMVVWSHTGTWVRTIIDPRDRGLISGEVVS